jgi:hypothetical protein
MEEARSSKTVITFYQTTHHIKKDSNLQKQMFNIVME